MSDAPAASAAEFVLVTTGSAGDLFPFLRMARALRERGQRVRLVAPQLHAEAVQRTGIPFHGTDADPAVLEDRDLWHPTRGLGIVWRAVRPGLLELEAVLAQLPPERPCVVVAHPLALPYAVALRDRALAAATARQSIHIVAAYLAPSNLPTVFDPLVMGPLRMPVWVPHGVRRWLWKLIATRLVDPVVLPDINADRRALGLPPAASLFDVMRDAPDLSVTLFPSWFGQRQPDWPAPLVCGDFALFDPDPDASFPPEFDAFLAAGSRPLVFTHGTGNRQAAAFFEHAMRATLQLGRRALFLTPHRAQLPAVLPPEVHWQPYLPLKRCLAHADLLVHHGGIGTTAEALRAGVAQLIVPLAFDQFDNGARVAALGCGQVLSHRRLGTRRLKAALARALALAPAPREGDGGAAWNAMITAIAGLAMGGAAAPAEPQRKQNGIID